MNINRGPSALGLQHMAARAQEVRKQFTPAAETTTTPNTGNTAAETGKSLPQATEKSPHQTEHATGLERAIERLQANAEKSPEAKGLQQALEKLQERQQSSTIVDTVA
jgi:hypothetical protein